MSGLSVVSYNSMPKTSAQSLVLVIFVITAFAAITVTLAALGTRELEIREIEEYSLKSRYASESGYERGSYYIKENRSITDSCTIEKNSSTCTGLGGDATTDKNPLDNGYIYTVIITLYQKNRKNGLDCLCDPIPEKNCCCVGPENYCVDSAGETPL